MNSAPENAKTIMFMSVDIAEATRFKESVQNSDETPHWLEAFETFFKELPLVLMGQIATTFAANAELPEVNVWKAIGDELVFRAQPRSAQDALLITEAFYRTVVTYNVRFFERWPLRLRGCCWAARFPGRNIEFQIREMAGTADADDDNYVDFLGPDVDLGFRLIPHAHSGQVILSLNLAEAIARLSDQHDFRFHYIGRDILKGVFMGRPYPLILITLADCMPELWQWEESEPPQLKILREDPPMTAEALIELADKIRNYLNRMCRMNLMPLEF